MKDIGATERGLGESLEDAPREDAPCEDDRGESCRGFVNGCQCPECARTEEVGRYR